MISRPEAPTRIPTGTKRASGLLLFVSTKLSPACFTRANTSPKWRTASVELIVDSIHKYVKYLNLNVNLGELTMGNRLAPKV